MEAENLTAQLWGQLGSHQSKQRVVACRSGGGVGIVIWRSDVGIPGW